MYVQWHLCNLPLAVAGISVVIAVELLHLNCDSIDAMQLQCN